MFAAVTVVHQILHLRTCHRNPRTNKIRGGGLYKQIASFGSRFECVVCCCCQHTISSYFRSCVSLSVIVNISGWSSFTQFKVCVTCWPFYEKQCNISFFFFSFAFPWFFFSGLLSYHFACAYVLHTACVSNFRTKHTSTFLLHVMRATCSHVSTAPIQFLYQYLQRSTKHRAVLSSHLFLPPCAIHIFHWAPFSQATSVCAATSPSPLSLYLSLTHTHTHTMTTSTVSISIHLSLYPHTLLPPYHSYIHGNRHHLSFQFLWFAVSVWFLPVNRREQILAWH